MQTPVGAQALDSVDVTDAAVLKFLSQLAGQAQRESRRRIESAGRPSTQAALDRHSADKAARAGETPSKNK